jgi:succinate dehydrogenase/fumarate reductase cytochrome b subunit (b558 family)
VSEASTAKSLFDKSRRPYLWRKLHSLSGVIPVGGFMCFHLFENSKAMQGQAPFDEAVSGISHMPYLMFLEFGMILLPLAFHAIYGFKLALESKPNVGRYTYTRNWMYTLQRVTGLLAFAFIVFHLSEYWWPKMTGRLGVEQFYPRLCANMASTIGPVPVVALLYVFGIAACAFHFANGLWGFCFSWGLTVSRRSQQMASVAFGLLGVVLFVLGANTAMYFATGSRFPGTSFGSGEDTHSSRTCADISYNQAHAGSSSSP